MKTIRINGTSYEWEALDCTDSDELAVYVDLGNGKMDQIGYADNYDEARDMVKDEIESLLAM